MRLAFWSLSLVFALSRVASADIFHVADLNTLQIRGLDRAKTVVLLPGGFLEEHGPYLPAFTDGILSDRLTKELARVARREAVRMASQEIAVKRFSHQLQQEESRDGRRSRADVSGHR